VRRARSGYRLGSFRIADYLADSVDAFLTSNPPSDAPSGHGDPFSQPDADVVHLGLTFSFPVEQTALGSGKILTWTKGFSAKHAIGNDVVKLLQDAFDRKHMHVKCVALVNDVCLVPRSLMSYINHIPCQTVGALLSRAYTAGGCVLGAIFGTGTNGAYIEDVGALLPCLPVQYSQKTRGSQYYQVGK
jgi:hexokinase